MVSARTLPAVLFAIALTLSGCGDSKPATPGATPAPAGATKIHKSTTNPPKLAFITNNPSEFWKIAAKGLEKFEKEKGVKVDMKLPPNGKVDEQMKIIEDLVSQGYNGIAISALSPDSLARDLNKAAEKLNVITHDSDAPTSKRIAYIGTNNFEFGKAQGEQMKKLLPEGGKIAVFVGTLSADNAAQRLNGIKDAIKGSKLEVVAAKEDGKDMNKARTNVEDVLNAYPDIAILAGLWSYNTPAIVDAVKASPRKGKIKIVGADEEDGTLAGIESGEVSCTVVQKPFEFGYQSAMLLYKLATEGEAAVPKNPMIDTGIEVIDAGNVKAFKEKLADMKK